jgi:hypothetical protein
MAQIEPIEFFGTERKGEHLRVYIVFPLSGDDTLEAVIYDKDDNVLFSTRLVAKSFDEVVSKLGLTLKTDTMDNTKELLTEIMEADAKDGLYEQEQRMYSEKEVLKMLLIKHDGLTPEYVLERFKKH